MEHGVDARGHCIPALVLETLEILAVPGHGLRGGIVREPGRLLHQRLLQSQQLGQLPRRGLPDRGRVAVIPVLLEERDPEPRSTRDGPPGGFELPGEQAKQGGLARPVAADNAPPLSLGDRERDA